MTSHRAPEEVEARVIIAACEAEGLPAFVAQTGGGIATIYAGAGPNEQGRYVLAIGPGRYEWDNPPASVFSEGDLWVSPDDDGESDPTEPASFSDADLRAAIRKAAGL